jgi:hypothetical protein
MTYLDSDDSRGYTSRKRGLFFFRVLLCVFVCVVYVLSDLTRCSWFGHWFPPASRRPARPAPGEAPGARLSPTCIPPTAPNSSWLRSIVCSVGGVPRVLIWEIDAPGPRCCRWFRGFGSAQAGQDQGGVCLARSFHRGGQALDRARHHVQPGHAVAQ